MKLLERDALLAELSARLGEARNGRGCFVLVSGEAGVGKTALVDAFVHALPKGSRVLRGACDPVFPPRPFAPVADMARAAADGLRAALDAADRDRVFDRFLRLLRDQGSGAVVVFEDLHWADSATLDLLRVVGRRLPELPIVLVGTVRAHDVDPDEAVRAMLGDVPPRVVTEVEVQPLTIAAVETLCSGTHVDARRLHEATGGNPFYVTEIMAAGSTTLPATVRDAVAARVARLSPDGRGTVGAAAVLGTNIETDLLIAVTAGPSGESGLRECVRRGVLIEHGGVVAFRHDLARQAVLDRLGPDERALLNRRALAALQRGVVAVDDARLAHHAIEAGDAAAIGSLAPRAARQASGLGAHGEAADYLAIALALPTATDDDRSRAEMLELYAYECSVSGRIAAARASQEAALGLWRHLDDRRREGDAMRALATYMWLGGEGDVAREMARSSVSVLEAVEPPGAELAHAYAKLAQLLLNSGQDDAGAREWARRARDLAERIDDEPLVVHAMTTLALADVYVEGTTGEIPRGWLELEAALIRAQAAGLAEDIARILINLVETARDTRRYDLADRYASEAVAFLADREFDLYRDLLHSRLAQMEVQRGRWTAAERMARDLLAGSRRASQARSRALGVLGLVRARRGEVGAWDPLDEALRVAGPGELQEVCPLRAIRSEAAWLEGDLGRAREEAAIGLELATPLDAPFWHSELSFWAWRTNGIDRLPDGTFRPYVLHATGRHREASEAWLEVGFPYEAALALADSPEEDDLRAALLVFQRLGAGPMVGRVTGQLRERGARHLPRGPRPSTRTNPGGLSDRELEVLGLIRAGARNAEIAERLVLSPKTVDHHVSAILRKLDVPDRAAARRVATELRIEDGSRAGPT
jgi:DNA-binding CsgD family transcriptional regulator